MNKYTLGVIALSVLLTGCSIMPKKGGQNLKLAPKATTMEISDTPVVTNSPKLKRTPPIKAIQALNKLDDIVIEAPVPVLSATMPEQE